MMGMPCWVEGKVLTNRALAKDHYRLSVELTKEFSSPAAGQFVMIRGKKGWDPLLSRPLSVFDFILDEKRAVLELLYRVVGRGTALLAAMSKGDPLLLLGPLGKGFSIFQNARHVLFVAGGVGIAPLIYLFRTEFMNPVADSLLSHRFYFGARSSRLLAGVERLEGRCDLEICTDDGSRGYRGAVTDLLQRDLSSSMVENTVVYACGPTPMIRSLYQILKRYPVPCQVSLEERMACGVGACLGCAVTARGPRGEHSYRRVCQDGPVFDIREIAQTINDPDTKE